MKNELQFPRAERLLRWVIKNHGRQHAAEFIETINSGSHQEVAERMNVDIETAKHWHSLIASEMSGQIKQVIPDSNIIVDNILRKAARSQYAS